MGAKNKVISGDYSGSALSSMSGIVSLQIDLMNITIMTLDKTTVEECEVMDASSTKSATSIIGRGLVSGFLLGGGVVGLLASRLFAKNKGVHVVAVKFIDGKKSVIEIDDNIYKALMKSCS